MGITESKKRAKKEYNKKVKKILLEFYPTDEKMIEFLSSKKPTQSYIKGLIKKEMEG